MNAETAVSDEPVAPPDAANATTPAASMGERRLEGQEAFERYLQGIVSEWLRVLALLGAALVPVFFVLDYYTRPEDLHLRFAVYRGIVTFFTLVQYALLRMTRPGRYYPGHGYAFSLVVSAMIVLMTVDMGGFDSSYYAGLILVLMAVNMLLCWRPLHSLLNGVLVILLYLGLNFAIAQPFDPLVLINNLYFLGSTVVITVAITWVRFKLVRSEFFLRAKLVQANKDLDESRAQLLRARDALWGEMQLAKMIQTALLPKRSEFGSYEVAALMVPADAVGGDYYDLIETASGERWVAIGDVSGHGVDSGLIMMMAQTAVQAIVNERPGLRPSEVLHHANKVLKENVARLGSDRYMTMLLFRIEPDYILVAGKHTDIMIYRARSRKVEMISTNGSWLGIADDLLPMLEDQRIPVGTGDIILLYTDGLTESRSADEEIFGEERLAQLFESTATLPLRRTGNRLMTEVNQFSGPVQQDDITFVLLKKSD